MHYMSRAFWIAFVVYLVVLALLVWNMTQCPAMRELEAEIASNSAYDASAEAEQHISPDKSADSHEKASKAHEKAAKKHMNSYKAALCKYVRETLTLRKNPNIKPVVERQLKVIQFMMKGSSLPHQHNLGDLGHKYVVLLTKVDSYLNNISSVQAGSPQDTKLLLDIGDAYDAVKEEQEKVVPASSPASKYSGASIFAYYTFSRTMHTVAYYKQLREYDGKKMVTQLAALFSNGGCDGDRVCLLAKQMALDGASKLKTTKLAHVYSGEDIKRLDNFIKQTSVNDNYYMENISKAVDLVQAAQDHSTKADLHSAMSSDSKVKSAASSIKAADHAEGEANSAVSHSDRESAQKKANKHKKDAERKISKLADHERDAIKHHV
jgi:hypothetical protein